MSGRSLRVAAARRGFAADLAAACRARAARKQRAGAARLGHWPTGRLLLVSGSIHAAALGLLAYWAIACRVRNFSCSCAWFTGRLGVVAGQLGFALSRNGESSRRALPISRFGRVGCVVSLGKGASDLVRSV